MEKELPQGQEELHQNQEELQGKEKQIQVKLLQDQEKLQQSRDKLQEDQEKLQQDQQKLQRDKENLQQDQEKLQRDKEKLQQDQEKLEQGNEKQGRDKLQQGQKKFQCGQKDFKLDQKEVIEWNPANDPRPSDITLVIDSWRFYVHRDILMRSSDYFKAMFSSHMIESRKDEVELHLVSPEVFIILVEGMYTGNLALTEDNAFGVLQDAEMLQIGDPLKSLQLSFMRKTFINIRQCFELMYFCVPLNLTELYSEARKFCLGHFLELKDSDTLTGLSLSELYDYLSDTYLVVVAELHVIEAIHTWVRTNKNTIPYRSQDFGLRDKVKKMIIECVSVKKVDVDVYDVITNAVFSRAKLPFERAKPHLATRKRQEDVFLFWAKLANPEMTNNGLADILKLDLETGYAVKVGTMTNIVERPGLQMGSASCYLGPYVYISGGGPDFSKVNWIRQIWRFDISRPYSPWETVGDLIEFRRNHAMVSLHQKLYIFGGFGKYRLKNVQMHSFDLTTGNWEQLDPMPVHEFNPPTATADNCIYYISSDWTVHCFSLESHEWTRLDFFTQPALDSKPMTLFPFKRGESRCFAIASVVSDALRMRVLDVHAPSMTLHRLQEVADMPNHFTYTNCVPFKEKLVIFFSSEKSDNPFAHNENSSDVRTVWTFDPFNINYGSFCNVKNVIQALSIVTLPYLPDCFSLELKELQ